MLPRVRGSSNTHTSSRTDRVVINKRLMAGREHMVRNEIAVLKRVSVGHRNILTLVDYFETMNNCESSPAKYPSALDFPQYTL